MSGLPKAFSYLLYFLTNIGTSTWLSYWRYPYSLIIATGVREEPIGMTCDLYDGGGGAVGTEVEEDAGNVGRHKGDTTGAHDVQTRVLFSCNFVSVVI